MNTLRLHRYLFTYYLLFTTPAMSDAGISGEESKSGKRARDESPEAGPVPPVDDESDDEIGGSRAGT